MCRVYPVGRERRTAASIPLANREILASILIGRFADDAALNYRPRTTGPSAMPFVVTENCIKCKHTDCVEVCPVDCFHEGPNFLVIDPDECIDCTLCEPECPVNAIFPEEDVPAGQEAFVALNAELAKDWPVLTTRKDPLPDAAEWDGKPGKLALLER